MSVWHEVRRLPGRARRRYRKWRLKESSDHVAYEATWDRYARDWTSRYPELGHIGDEWTGEAAGAARSLEEYNRLIEDRFISPYIESTDTVIEIGVGGGKTSSLLLKHADLVICADISAEMLAAAKSRLGEERVRYVKLDGRSMNPVANGSADVCFSFDTMVHIEPRDIFNYLTQIPRILRGRRLCILHHGTMLSELGWRRFLAEWQQNLMGKRHGGAFSVMTDSIMERFLQHLGYEVLAKDTESIPRDVVWIARAPERVPQPLLGPPR